MTLTPAGEWITGGDSRPRGRLDRLGAYLTRNDKENLMSDTIDEASLTEASLTEPARPKPA